MTIERLAPQAGVSWETAARFVDAAKRFEHGAVACRVMAGLVLLELRKEHGTNQGARRDLATSPNDLEKLNWPDLVRRELGVSDQTASNWMRMADAARSRLVADDVAGVFRQLLETPLAQLSDDQAKALSTGVEQLVDGRSQLDFMASLGLLAPPPAKGGDAEWEAFIRLKHPEMIVDGKVPSRGKAGKVSKDVVAEFSKWLEAKAKPRTAKEKQDAARALLAALMETLEGAVKSPLLMVLDPVEFAPVESLTKLWAERLRQLSDSRR